MVGLGFYHGMWRRLGKYLEGAEHYTMVDFSGFDQSLPAWLIREAFKFVIDLFDKVREDDTPYWNYMYDNLVRTLIAYPSGELLRKKRGVASGDPWTSVIGSVCNYLMMSTVLDPRYYKIFVFGDDSIIGYYPSGVPGMAFFGAAKYQSSRWEGGDDVSLSSLSLALKADYGVTVSVKKSYRCSKLYITNEEIESGAFRTSAQFLSMWFGPGGYPVPKTSSVLEHLFCPERGKNDVNWEKLRTISYYINSFWNPVLQDHLFHYYVYLNVLEPSIVHMSPSDFQVLNYLRVFDTGLMTHGIAELPTATDVVNMYTNYTKGAYTREEYFAQLMFERNGLDGLPYHLVPD